MLTIFLKDWWVEDSVFFLYFCSLLILISGNISFIFRQSYWEKRLKAIKSAYISWYTISGGAILKILTDKQFFSHWTPINALSVIVSIFLFPLIFTLITISVPLISILLSDKWLFSIPLFQLLCIASIFNPFYSLNSNVLNSRGESKKTLQLELIKKGLIIISILLCISFGIKVMLVGLIIANTISYLISMFYIKKNIQYQLKIQVLDIFPSFIISIFVSFIVFQSKGLITGSNQFILLLSQTGIALVLYSILFIVFEKELFLKIKHNFELRKKIFR